MNNRVLNFFLLFFLLGACSPKQESTKTKTVAQVMDGVITSLYATMSEAELEFIDRQKALSFFNESDLNVLATRHWVFDVNVPAVVSIMRSEGQKTMPFWLESSGFEKTKMTMQNEFHTYEVWQKKFDKGTVELGINGLENFAYHYFVSVAPQNKSDNLVLSNFIPENQPVSVLDDGAFTYRDWTELVLFNVPEEMKGQKLLNTIRGRGKESHLVGAFRKTIFPSSAQPDQVMLTWSSDPASGVDVQWRTNTTVESGEVKFRLVGSNDVQQVKAEKFVMEDRELMNDRFVHRFTAKLRNLSPGSNYEYLIAPENDWAQACTFSTPENDDAFSFVWFGDVHNRKEFGDLHQKAEVAHPEAAFYMIAGDLVNDGLYRNQWDELFGFSKDVICRKPLMNVPGNHDNRLGLGSKMYRDMFSYPTNGPEGVPQEQTYSFVYKNTLFLMLDATSSLDAQTGWIESQLAQTSATWKIAVFHFPPYNWEEPYLDIQEAWLPVFDKYHVDMVFNGHIHYYMRSKPLKGGRVVDSYNDGTAYIVSLGIPGRNQEITDEPYAAMREQNSWLYQHINIDGEKLFYQSVNMDGEVIDQFTIHKE
ncbi:Purple acid Phosphatase, N-terminal domain [Mariniphaga anaerophila]|uniref:Purple acid Phosphatase, N-terminal domain n=1 Tax=Mariniphaga anaerophila TaxID=1484053 RepID=A0A1M4ZXX9_9BACT|nr:metallophosphoesterase family protein [Mariniphaga anaerophila]SHF22835.1 Purple acid Phosphatase, N-terminal domain [Mariniphaga anaerophila]